MIMRIHLCFQHGLKIKGPHDIRFAPGVNVIAGPNGSGKSTLLEALHSCRECRIERDDDTETVYFDSETMNPHRPEGPPGDLRTMILRTRGVFSSHGEIMTACLATLPIRSGGVLLIDEPETGQDIEGVRRIREGFDALHAQGVQVIAASHHPLIWAGAVRVETVPEYSRRTEEKFRRHLCKSKRGNP